MFKQVSGAIVAAVMMVGLVAGPAEAGPYTPAPGATFNNPRGTSAQKNMNINKVRQTIDSTRSHGVIRIALYSFNRPDIVQALIRACQNRNVAVQMVLNNNTPSAQSMRMQRLLGTKITPKYRDACNPRRMPVKKRNRPKHPPYPVPSFFKFCSGACRLGSDRSNQHMKYFLFSKVGPERKPVVMFGSTNLTGFAAYIHWNDMFTVVGNKPMFTSYSEIFGQMALDRRVKKPYVVVKNGPYVSEFGAKPGATGKRDPVWQRLNKIDCRAPKGYGIKRHTAIRIMQYGWRGFRGRVLARKVAELSRAGCRIQVIASGADGPVRNTLKAAHVQVRSAAIDLDEDPETGFEETGWEVFSHEKWMSVNGRWDGQPFRGVFTGSENWSSVSLYNDELTVEIPKSSAHRAYMRHFYLVWNNYTRGRYGPIFPPERAALSGRWEAGVLSPFE